VYGKQLREVITVIAFGKMIFCIAGIGSLLAKVNPSIKNKMSADSSTREGWRKQELHNCKVVASLHIDLCVFKCMHTAHFYRAVCTTATDPLYWYTRYWLHELRRLHSGYQGILKDRQIAGGSVAIVARDLQETS